LFTDEFGYISDLFFSRKTVMELSPFGFSMPQKIYGDGIAEGLQLGNKMREILSAAHKAMQQNQAGQRFIVLVNVNMV
jgi:hypothetical protein